MSDGETKVWSVIEVRNWAIPYFTKAQVDSPRKTIELMLCAVLHTERLGLYMQHERLLSPVELRALRTMIDRRVRAREPLQYIIGSTNFFGYEIAVDSRVLIPRPETEELVDKALTALSQYDAPRILDIGTGSGCMPVVFGSKLRNCHVTAMDVSEQALQVARANAQKHGLDSIEFVHASVFDDVPFTDRFDCIVSNPPYIANSDMGALDPEVRSHEPVEALTDHSDGYRFYKRFAEIFPKHLKDNGVFFLEIGTGMASTINQILSSWQLDVHKDLDGRERIVEGRRK
jgi:release factor glutamine methyltransferase